MKTARKGFTLTEMLFIIGILSVAGLLSSRLFTTSIKVIRSAPDAQAHSQVVDLMSQSPSEVDPKQLRDLGIKLANKEV